MIESQAGGVATLFSWFSGYKLTGTDRMIRLHYSNRLEELIAPLAKTIGMQQRRDPLARAVVVVPNRIVEEFLKLRLAQAAGVAANIEFPFLRRYLGRVVEAADPGCGVLDADQLELVIFECLRAGVDRAAPDFSAVAQYVSGGSQRAEDRELRLIELSVRTARLFREYAISRAAMLSRWRAGPAPELESMRESERWQRHLYLSIFGPDDRVLPRWVAAENSRFFLLTSALAAIAPDRLCSALAKPLHIFGLSYAGPEFARIFAKLGEAIDLYVYALNPCLEFWEDVEGADAIGRDRFVRRGHKIGEALERVEDPFSLDASGENAALRQWGKPGREYIRLLNELTDCDFDAHFKHPPPGTMLARLQESILCREPEASSVSPPGSFADDESIRLLGCPGIRREVEIVADSIWSLIRDDEKRGGSDPLRFHQIGVLLPEAELDSYLPQVETVFAQRHQIPLDLVDRPFTAEGRVVEAVELLLALAMGHFARDEVLHLVTHPALIGAAPVDTESWEHWCQSLGVFFGADERELSDTYIPPNHYHWDQGLRRLALGVFMEADGGGLTPVLAPNVNEYLPCESAQDEMDSVAALIESVRKLIAEALDLRSRRLTMVQWARLLSDLVRTYIKPADPAGRAVADFCAAAIESMASEELRGEPVGYPVAYASARARLSAAQTEQGRYAESGVAVGSFSALRSIPFRVIFALGLGERTFPEREKYDLLDLRLARRRAGDVSASQRDRYLFLETILAARERIFLSWISRDALTGQTLEPSPVIRELKLILRGYLGAAELDRLTTIHPASSYDREYFPDLRGPAPAGNLVSFDRHAHHGARMAALRTDLATACDGIALPGEGLLESLAPQVRSGLAPALRVIEMPSSTGAESATDPREIPLSLGALRRYLECPLQGAARYALGMIDEDDEDDQDLDNEPLTQSKLDLVVLLRDAFWAGRGMNHAARENFERALRLHQLQGRAPVGPFADAAKRTFSRKLDLCIEQAQALKIAGLDGWERIRIGGAQEIADADITLPPILLDVRMRRPAGDTRLRISLRGTVTVSPRRDASIRCIARDSGAKAGDFLEGFLGAIALAAAGQTNTNSFIAIVAGGAKDDTDFSKYTRKLRLPNAAVARAYLTALAEDLFAPNNHYFLPIDAVEEVLKKIAGQKEPQPRDIWEVIEDLRDNEMAPCRSDYGPIRNPRSFSPPMPAVVLEIIRRRFDLIEAIFAK